MSEREQTLQFCPACFADEEAGSWNHVVVGGYCTNCGNGSTVVLPRWAIGEIRRNASWVGRRYYPCDEDRENYAERSALLALVQTFPGRSAEQDKDDAARWNVRQMTKDGSISTTVIAQSAEEAMRKSGLRYVPDSEFSA